MSVFRIIQTANTLCKSNLLISPNPWISLKLLGAAPSFSFISLGADSVFLSILGHGDVPLIRLWLSRGSQSVAFQLKPTPENSLPIQIIGSCGIKNSWWVGGPIIWI